MSAILKRHCYHSNGNDVNFMNTFQLLEDCSIYVVQFLSSNKKPLFKKLNLNHDFVIFQKLYWATLIILCLDILKAYSLLSDSGSDSQPIINSRPLVDGEFDYTAKPNLSSGPNHRIRAWHKTYLNRGIPVHLVDGKYDWLISIMKDFDWLQVHINNIL
jgi:hypothetical protein